jgi:hypothetical protein
MGPSTVEFAPVGPVHPSAIDEDPVGPVHPTTEDADPVGPTGPSVPVAPFMTQKQFMVLTGVGLFLFDI